MIESFNLTFNGVNVSLQVGDMIYFTNTESSSVFEINQGNIQELSTVDSISISNNTTTITCLVDLDIISEENLPNENSFIFFSKDNSVNTSSVLGYYGLARFKNEDNQNKSEIYAAACEVSTSSK